MHLQIIFQPQFFPKKWIQIFFNISLLITITVLTVILIQTLLRKNVIFTPALRYPTPPAQTPPRSDSAQPPHAVMPCPLPPCAHWKTPTQPTTRRQRRISQLRIVVDELEINAPVNAHIVHHHREHFYTSDLTWKTLAGARRLVRAIQKPPICYFPTQQSLQQMVQKGKRWVVILIQL